MEQRVHEKEVEVGRQRATVAFQKALVSNRQSSIDPNRDVLLQLQEKLDIELALNTKIAEINGSDPLTLKASDDKTYLDFFNRYIAENIQPTTASDRKYIEVVTDLFPQDLPGRDDAARKAIENRRNAIWEGNKNEMLDMDGKYQTLLREGRYTEAMALRNGWGGGKNWGQIREDIWNSTEYNPGNKPQLERTFELPRTDGSGGSGRLAEQAKKIRDYYLGVAQDSTSGQTPEKATRDYFNALQKLCAENGTSLGQFLYTEEGKALSMSFIDDALATISERYKTISGKTLFEEGGVRADTIKTLISQYEKNFKNDREGLSLFNEWLMQSSMNWIADYGTGGIPSLIQSMNRTAEGIVNLNIIKNRNERVFGWDLNSPGGMNKAIAGLEDNDFMNTIRTGSTIVGYDEQGNAVYEPGTDVFVANTQQRFDEVGQILSDEVRQRLHLPAGKVIFSYQNQKTPAGNEKKTNFDFVVLPGTKNERGEEAGGKYRLAASRNNDGQPTNNAPVLQKWDSADQKWEDVTVTTPAGKEVSSAQELRKEEKNAIQLNIDRHAFLEGIKGQRTRALRGGQASLAGNMNQGVENTRRLNQLGLSSLDLIKNGVTGSWQIITDNEAVQRQAIRGLPKGQIQEVVEAWRRIGINPSPYVIESAK
jgi:hypothetical protein